MTPIDTNPINIIILLGLLSLLPVIFIMTTSFVKISMVLILTRESLGVQQIPPNIVIYSLSVILSFYVMGPVYNDMMGTLSDASTSSTVNNKSLVQNFQASSGHIKTFLFAHTPTNEKEFFYQSIKRFWTPEMVAKVKKDDLIILVPAFMVSEITSALKIGFLIYLPSVMIDIIVSNILMAMGMMMMSPVTISLPIKILLFTALNGWSRLIHALLSSYLH
ncbi:MAG: type III secretion system export apparatus subunit SctR [Proteobacteria bacterium]|nr:type III secretion system export apparatus subunit SctR [Pseudomonadota bacterium]